MIVLELLLFQTHEHRDEWGSILSNPVMNTAVQQRALLHHSAQGKLQVLSLPESLAALILSEHRGIKQLPADNDTPFTLSDRLFSLNERCPWLSLSSHQQIILTRESTGRWNRISWGKHNHKSFLFSILSQVQTQPRRHCSLVPFTCPPDSITSLGSFKQSHLIHGHQTTLGYCWAMRHVTSNTERSY